MQNIHFLVSNTLSQQIKEAMSRLGINSKAEFFRMLILNSTKESSIPPPKNAPERKMIVLTGEEATILAALEEGPKQVDDLFEKTEIPVGKISALLVQLLIKKCVIEKGAYWEIKPEL